MSPPRRARRGLSVLEIALALALFAALAAFVVPRLTATAQASADRQAKATLGAAVDAQIATRAALRAFSDDPATLGTYAPSVTFAARAAPSLSARTASVALAADRASATVAVFAREPGSSTAAACWVALVSARRVLYGVRDAATVCAASDFVGRIAPDPADPARGATLDRPLAL